MMGLSRFPTVMAGAADAVIATAAALRRVRDSAGDLPFRDLDAIQDGLRAAKVSTFAAFAEAAKQPAAAEAFMANMGGPPSLAAYRAAAGAIEVAAAGWNAFLAAWLSGLPRESLIAIVVRSYDGIETKHVERPAFVAAEVAAPLRASAQLAALVAAFESVGA